MSKYKKAACYNAVVECLKSSTTPMTVQEIADVTNYHTTMVRAQILQDARNDGQQIQEVGGGRYISTKTFKYEEPAIITENRLNSAALAALAEKRHVDAKLDKLIEEALTFRQARIETKMCKKLK